MKAYIVTCMARNRELTELWNQLTRDTDWKFPIAIIYDYHCPANEGVTDPNARGTEAFRTAIEIGYREGFPWFLLLEDDSEVNLHLQHNLQTWEPLVRGLVGYGKLSTNEGNKDVFCEGRNWYNPDSQRVYGLQGAVITRSFAKYALEHWNDIGLNADLKLARMGGSNQVGHMFVYWPSLVRHRHEVESLCGHGSIKTMGFDKEFKS